MGSRLGPEIRGGPVSKFFFRPFGSHFGLKIKGGGGPLPWIPHEDGFFSYRQMGLLLYWGINKLGGGVFEAEAKVTVVDFLFQMSFPKCNVESWEISSSVVTCSNHCVPESSRSFRNRGNFMIYFCMIASLPNAILWDVGTVILSRSTNSFGLIVYYRVSSIEYPFQKHAKKSRDIL